MMLMPMRFRRQGLRFGAGDPSWTAAPPGAARARALASGGRALRCAALPRAARGPHSASLPRPLREAGRRCACARAAGHGQLARFEACGAVPWGRGQSPVATSTTPGPSAPRRLASVRIAPLTRAPARHGSRSPAACVRPAANVGHGIGQRMWVTVVTRAPTGASVRPVPSSLSLTRSQPGYESVSSPPREADRDRAAARLAPARAWPSRQGPVLTRPPEGMSRPRVHPAPSLRRDWA